MIELLNRVLDTSPKFFQQLQGVLTSKQEDKELSVSLASSCHLLQQLCDYLVSSIGDYLLVQLPV